MKIAFVPQPLDRVLPPRQSSIGIVTHQLARRLAKSCSVLVYLQGSRQGKREEKADGLHYRYILMGPDRRLLRLLHKIPNSLNHKRPMFASRSYYLGYILQVALDLRTRQCDIVHLHNFSQFVPIIRALNPKIKIVVHMHCEWLVQLDRKMIERRLRTADLIISVSEHITQKTRLSFPQFADRCHTVYNGVDINQFHPNNDRQNKSEKSSHKRILFVGRISPEKGVHILLDAFSKILKRHPSVDLQAIGSQTSVPIEYIVGLSDDRKVKELASFYTNGYFSHLKRKISSDLADRVIFTKPLPHSHLVEYYSDGNIFVFPSVGHEAFGMPIIEAMACCLPVVATRAGGIPEIVEDGKTGFLVERSNSYELADAVLRLLEDDNLRQSMGVAGRRRVVERFTWSRAAENVLNLYENL